MSGSINRTDEDNVHRCDSSMESLEGEGSGDLISSLKNVHGDLKTISPGRIVVSEWVRFKCRYGCPAYGQTLSCPPFSPTPEETRRLLAEYKMAVLIHAQTSPDPSWTKEQYQSHVKECRSKLHRDAIEIERAAFLMGRYKALAMGVGPCDLCDICVIKEKANALKTNALKTNAMEESPNVPDANDQAALDCRHKEMMRPAMDAFGIDIFQTVRNAGYEIGVLKSHTDPVDLYSMVLIE